MGEWVRERAREREREINRLDGRYEGLECVNEVEPNFKLQTKDNKAQILFFCYFVNAHKLCVVL